MDDRFIDIILFAAVAIFLAYRLWSVLGQRPDDAAKPPNLRMRPGPDRDQGSARPPGAGLPGSGWGRGRSGDTLPSAKARGSGPNDNVVALPARGGKASEPVPVPPPSDPLAAGLADITGADPSFRLDAFLEGARHAFELIVKGYAEGDTPTLRPLLSDEVYDVFAEGIRARMAQQETVETRVVRFQDPRATAARLQGRTALVSVRFASSQVSVTRDANGQIVEGDPERAVDRVDTWTFSRNTRSLDPNWILVETEAAES